MKNYCLLFILLSIIFSQPILGQLTPAQAVAGMGRGINLGNTLEPPTEGAWNNGPAEEAHFDAYVAAGFTNVRVPVRWDEHTADAAPFEIDESWMNRVEEVIDWGLNRGLYITLNGHHEDWLKNDYANQTLRDRYDAIWIQVAERFKDKSEQLLFEIINEPNGMTVAEVDDLNARILGFIRVSNPTRNVIYGGNMYANSEQLFDAVIPNDDFVIGYYHAYDPWNFSGQGNGTWGTAGDYQAITNKYQSVKNWSTANNISIHHSEFGAIHVCDFNSRMRIYAHNVEQCLVNGFAFSVWDDGGDFGILNRADNTWPEVKDILAHYYEDSPNEIFSSEIINPLNNEPAVKLEWNNRAIGNGNIIIERLNSGTNSFGAIAELPPDATTLIDLTVGSSGTYTYRMYTTRADGTLLHGYPTRVTITSSVQTPFNPSPIEIPGELEIEEYDNGGEGLAYHDNEPENISAGFRPEEGVDIGGFAGGYILGYVVQGEWIEFTVNVTQAGSYSVKADIASEIANGAFSITFDKNNATTSFSTPSTGGWVAIEQISANNEIELEAGEQVMRFEITNNNAFNLDKLIFTLESVGVTNLASEAGFKVAPNPTHGIVNIELSAALKKDTNRLELFRVTGEKVADFKLDSSTHSLDLSGFGRGTYLLHLVNDAQNLMQRIVIQ